MFLFTFLLFLLIHLKDIETCKKNVSIYISKSQNQHLLMLLSLLLVIIFKERKHYHLVNIPLPPPRPTLSASQGPITKMNFGVHFLYLCMQVCAFIKKHFVWFELLPQWYIAHTVTLFAYVFWDLLMLMHIYLVHSF